MRLALPKGRLLKQVLSYCASCGYDFSSENGDRDYDIFCSDPTIKAKLVKVKAIPQSIALGNYDAGFVGLDLLLNSNFHVQGLVDLGLQPVKLVVAQSQNSDVLNEVKDRPIVIATEYENIARKWASQKGISHIVIQTYGSTEGYVPDDADLVLDNVDTGDTMKANRLEIIEELFTSTTYLAGKMTSQVSEFIHRLQL